MENNKTNEKEIKMRKRLWHFVSTSSPIPKDGYISAFSTFIIAL